MTAHVCCRWRCLVILAALACSGPTVVWGEEESADLPPLPDIQTTGKASKNSPEVLAEFDISREPDGIVLPVTMFGKTYPFVVSITTPEVVVEEKLKLPLGKPIEFRKLDPSGQKKEIQGYFVPDLKIGSISLFRASAEKIYALDLSAIRHRHGREIAGILGMNALREQILRIDFDRGTLQFLSKRKTRPGEKLLLHEAADKSPMLFLKLPGGAIRQFEISTTYTGGLTVDADVLASLRKVGAFQGSVTSKKATFHGVGSSIIELDAGVLTDLSLAPNISLHGVGVMGPLTSSTIGLGCLSRFVVVLDFPEHFMYLQPGQRFAVPDSLDHSGLLVWKPGAKLQIFNVRKESAGEKAGLQEGDEILSIDGHDAHKLSMYAVKQSLHRAGQTLQLKIKRGDRQFDISLLLKEPVPDPSKAKGTLAGKPKEVVPEKELPKNLRVAIPRPRRAGFKLPIACTCS